MKLPSSNVTLFVILNSFSETKNKNLRYSVKPHLSKNILFFCFVFHVKLWIKNIKDIARVKNGKCVVWMFSSSNVVKYSVPMSEGEALDLIGK